MQVCPVSETYGTNTTLQVSSSKLTAQFIRANVEAKLGYDRAFKDHQLSASVVYRQEMEETFGNVTMPPIIVRM